MVRQTPKSLSEHLNTMAGILSKIVILLVMGMFAAFYLGLLHPGTVFKLFLSWQGEYESPVQQSFNRAMKEAAEVAHEQGEPPPNLFSPGATGNVDFVEVPVPLTRAEHLTHPIEKPSGRDLMALLGAKREPSFAELEARQDTPQGRLDLGLHFYERLRSVAFVLPELNRAVKRLVEPPQGGVRSSSPTAWWDLTHSVREFNYDEYSRTFDEELFRIAQNRPGPERDADIWRLVIRCGRDWLKVPYDEKLERFDLVAPMPADSPEAAVHYCRQVYKNQTDRDYGATNSEWWRELQEPAASGTPRHK